MPSKKIRGGSGNPRAASAASPIETTHPKSVQDLIGSLVGGKRRRVGGTRKRVGGRTRKGGRHTRRHTRRRNRSRPNTPRSPSPRRRKGGSGHAGLLATAALPFGLFGLQKLFQKRRTRRQVRKMSKTLKKDLRKLDVRRYLK